MDFTPTDEQRAVFELARTIFTDQASPDRVKEVEATDERVDRDLWLHLANAGLLAIAIPEAHGGAGLGFSEVALVLEAQGHAAAPIPLNSTLVGAAIIAAFGDEETQAAWLPAIAAGNAMLATALAEGGHSDPLDPSTQAIGTGSDLRISGTKYAVSGGHVANLFLVTTRLDDGTCGVVGVVPDATVTLDRQVGLNHEIAPTVTFSNSPGRLVGGPAAARALVQQSLVGLSAVAVGVATEAVERTAVYTSNREQFGRPLSTNQGLMMECADAFIATEAMRVCVQNAAWRLAEGLDATREVLVAKWWAADGGLRATHMALHLHGGMGADVDYPIQRYLLWGKQIAAAMGGPQAQLARLGATLAEAS